MKRVLVTWLASMLATSTVVGQGLPTSDLVEVTIADDQVSTIERLTNNDGYTSQPLYLASGNQLYYTQQVGELTQVLRFDRLTGQHQRVTNTETNLYSPTPHGANRFTAVSGDKQLLMQFDLDANTQTKATRQQMVGYHAWQDSGQGETLWMAVVEGTADNVQMNLYKQQTGSDQIEPVLNNVGRSLKPYNDDLYTIQDTHIVRIDKLGHVNPVAPMPTASTDFTIDSSGHIWAGSGVKLLRLYQGQWQVMANLETFATQQHLASISRLDLNNDRTHIVLVMNRVEVNSD